MLRTKLAKKVLTKAEQKHLTVDAGIHNMAQMLNQVAYFKRPDAIICYECKRIAIKLNLLV